MIQFEVGKTYSCRSACDSNCVWIYKVIARTNKTIQLQKNVTQWDSVKTRYTVKDFDGVEIIYPNGKYSMAPTLKADREYKEVTTNV